MSFLLIGRINLWTSFDHLSSIAAESCFQAQVRWTENIFLRFPFCEGGHKSVTASWKTAWHLWLFSFVQAWLLGKEAVSEGRCTVFHKYVEICISCLSNQLPLRLGKKLRPYFSHNRMGSHTWYNFEITGLPSLQREWEGMDKQLGLGPREAGLRCKTLEGAVPTRFLWDCQLHVQCCGRLNPRFSYESLEPNSIPPKRYCLLHYRIDYFHCAQSMGTWENG